MPETTPGIDETLLDLDALDPVTQRVKVFGREVPLHAPSAFLVKLLDRVTAMERAQENNTPAYSEALDTLVAGIVPDLSAEERDRLTSAKQALIIGRGFATAQIARARVLEEMRAVAEGNGAAVAASGADAASTSTATT